MSTSSHCSERAAYDLGECEIHNRPLECFSLDALELICASCLIFGPHKGENVCGIEEAGKFARSKLDEAAKQGLLRVDRTESVLLDIRQTKLSCEEAKNRVLKEVEDTFSSLIKKLKERKNTLVSEVEGHFSEQAAKIKQQEDQWIDKQVLTIELLKYAKSGNQSKLVQNGSYVVNGIEQLAEPLQFTTTQILSTVDLSFKILEKKKDLNTEELLRALDNYGQKGEIINVNFRC